MEKDKEISPYRMAARLSIMGIAGAWFTTVMIGGPYLFWSGMNLVKETEDRFRAQRTEIKNLTHKAITLSSGEDRIWSDDEKVEFLKSNRIDYPISINEKLTFNYLENRVIVSNDNDPNSSIGSIGRATLNRYINSK